MATPFPSICLVDYTKKISADDLAKVALALQAQVNRDFSQAPPYGWSLAASIHASQAPQPFEWICGLFTDATQPGALGFHDETQHGQPLMSVFPFVDPSTKWSTIASHEVLECLLDPNICKAAQSPIDGKFHALECCDACEGDSYEISGIAVSDFVLPPFFETPKITKGLKFDFMGLIKKPLELRPGGYDQFYDPSKGWQQVFADRQSAYRALLVDSRSKRRQRGAGGTR